MQLALFAPTRPAPATPAHTWAGVRRGERIVFDMPGSPWSGRWVVRRTEDHPSARYLLIVTLVDEHGRTWTTWMHRDVAVPGCGFTLEATR